MEINPMTALWEGSVRIYCVDQHITFRATRSINFSAMFKTWIWSEIYLYLCCAVRLFETFPLPDLLMLWNSITDHVLLPLLLDGFRKMSIHPELITLSQTRGHGGDNCVPLELKDEFSWCDHPIIKHFPHFLFVIKSISGASGHSVSDPITRVFPGSK